MSDKNTSDSMSAAAAAQGILGIGQEIQSGIMRKKAQRNYKPYEIPSGIDTMLQRAGALASQTEIPGADIYRSQARSNAAQTVEASQRTAQSAKDILNILPQVQGNLDTFYNDVASKGASFYQQNQNQLQNALNTYGQYEAKRWNMNVYLPYIQAMQSANVMGQSGNQNIGSAISSAMNIDSLKNMAIFAGG